ncbi:MAG: hypothetical protein OHK0053_01440 [Microscillaceae bacterium]
MKKTGLSFFVLLLLGAFHLLPAQRSRLPASAKARITEGYVSVALQVNAFHYTGDIPSGLSMTRPGLTAYLSRKLSPHLHARLGLSWGRIEGDDFLTAENSGTYARNLHFRNDLAELSLMGVWEFIPSFGKHGRRAGFSPYLFGGLALVHHNPQAKIPTTLGDEWADLQPLGTEGQGRPGYAAPYSKVQWAFPVGLGLTWALNKRWNLGVETSVRFMFFDYLDDVSGQYPHLYDLGNPLAVALSNRTLEATNARNGAARNLEAVSGRFGAPISYIGFDGQVYETVPSFERGQSTRGNPQSRDMYFVTGIHLSYIINVGLKCPQFLW